MHPWIRRASAVVAILCPTLLALGTPQRVRAEPVDVGYRDFYYGVIVNSTPTGEKPESKLWFNDGIWWGTLWDSLAGRYEIHRFNPGTQSWSTTGVPIDDRHSTKGDALWDGEHLYVASHIFTTSAGPTVPVNSARLYRFSYNSVSKTYTPNIGFPILINSSKSETLVLDKDSTGRLWVTWMEAGRAKINCSLGSDILWGTPFDLPVQSADATTDDVCSLIAFGGNKIGVFWSNQITRDNRFAIHVDTDPPGTWQPSELVSTNPTGEPLSDDHISLKTHAGMVYAVTKTNETVPTQPLVLLNRRDVSGNWTVHVVGTKAENHTRAILLLDPEHDLLHVLATCALEGRNRIYRKTASMSAMVFAGGRGDLFIDSPSDPKLGNVSSTKQNITSQTGMLAIASEQDTRYYFHNYYATPPTADVPWSSLGRGESLLSMAPSQPNPFRRSTRIPFSLRTTGSVELAVYDLNGRKIRELLDRELPAGDHSETWDGRDDRGLPVPGGVYFARLAGSGGTAWQRLVILR